MHTFDWTNLASNYPRLIELCETEGELVSPRAKPCRELRPVVIRTYEGSELADAGFSYRFADAEAAAYLAGWDDVAWLARFNPTIGRFSDDGRTFHGAYGKRLEHQLKHAVAKLQSDRDSRQVVLPIFQAGDLWVSSKDIPCNTQLLLKLRQDHLHLTAIVRSQDVIWGLPYDHHAWWAMALQLAKIIGVGVHSVTHFIDSLHLYEPSAGFYEPDRVVKAKGARFRAFSPVWPLEVGSVAQLREALMQARMAVEGYAGERLAPSVQRLVERLK